MSGPSSPFGGGWNKFRDFAEGGLPFGGHMPTSFGDFAKGGLPFGGHMPFGGGGGGGGGGMPLAGPQIAAGLPGINNSGATPQPALGMPSPGGTGMALPPGLMQTSGATPQPALGMPTGTVTSQPGILTQQPDWRAGGGVMKMPQWGNIGYPPGGGPNPVFGDMAADKAAGMNVSNGPIMHTPLFGSQDPNSPQASQGSVPIANSPTQNYSPVGTGAMPPGVSSDLITQTLANNKASR